MDGELLPQFKIFSGVLKAYTGQDGRKRLKGIASSTTRDLHGDNMLESALRDMEVDANDNLTIFLNHSYDVPEDVAGSVEKAIVIQRGADHEGNPNWDLDVDILVDDENPRALRAFNAIGRGAKLGLSIGALIPTGGAVRDKKTGALTISHVKLLETSIVSIPANPRSWISAATKAWRHVEQVEKGQTFGLGQPQLELEGNEYTIRGTLDGLRIADSLEVREGLEVELGETAELVVEAESCPSCHGGKGAPKGDCGNAFHGKEVTPDVQDASVRIIEIDTGPSGGSPSSQEDSGGSDPESETLSLAAGAEGAADPAPAAETLAESIDPVIREAVEALSTLLESTTARLETTMVELETERSARLQAERERDETATATLAILTQAKAVFEKLAETPVGRKTQFKDARASLARLDGIYSEQFLQLLAQGDPS